MGETLKPCPFCGDRFVHAEPVNPAGTVWGIHCPNGMCPTAGNFVVTDFSEAEAVAAWNKRVAPEATGIREEVVGVIREADENDRLNYYWVADAILALFADHIADAGKMIGPNHPEIPDSSIEALQAKVSEQVQFLHELESQVRKLTEENEELKWDVQNQFERANEAEAQALALREGLERATKGLKDIGFMAPNVTHGWAVQTRAIAFRALDDLKALSLSVGEGQQQNQQLGSSQDLSHTASVKLKGGE